MAKTHVLIADDEKGITDYLATRPDGAEIRRLSFEKNIPSILFEEPAPSDMPIPAVNQTDESRSCVSRNTIVSTAYGYITNSKYLSSTNINGSGCGNRVKPRYLGSAGTYSSVPYDWGGFDTVSSFNNYMSPNTYAAGDIDNTASNNCSRGLDCSGYVSRAWQLSTRKTTYTMGSVSYELSEKEDMLRGDIFNNPFDHVVLFGQFVNDDGMYGYEATTYGNYDRVVYIYSNWSRFSAGYVPRRFNTVCP